MRVDPSRDLCNIQTIPSLFINLRMGSAMRVKGSDMRFVITLAFSAIIATLSGPASAFRNDKITKSVAPSSKVILQSYILYDLSPCRSKPAPAVDPRTPEFGKITTQIVKLKLANGPCGADYEYNALQVIYESGARAGLDKFTLHVHDGSRFTAVPVEINVRTGGKPAAMPNPAPTAQPRVDPAKTETSAAATRSEIKNNSSVLPTVTKQVSVLSGKSIVAGFTYHLHNNCSAAGPIEFKILKEPNHGKLRLSSESGFTTYGKDDKRAICNEKPSEVSKIFYDANMVAGRDHFIVEAFYINGNSRKFDISVDVK